MIDTLLERWTLLFFAPGAELVTALIVAIACVVVARPFVRRARTDRAEVPPILRVTAAVVIAGWLIDVVAQALWIRFPSIAWWSFALPLVLAALGIGVASVATRRSGSARGARRSGEPTLVGVRRAWRSFSSTGAMVVTGALVILLGLTTVISGSVSSVDEYGRSVLIDFGDAGVATFFGWAYGIPVLVALVMLGAATVVGLARIAAPPFAGSASLSTERRGRQIASHTVLSLASAAVALSWGAALQVIGRAGSGSAGVGIEGVGDFVWSPGYSSFAGVFTAAGWLVEVVALLALIAVAAGVVPFGTPARRADARSAEAVAR